ncbi:MAG TPA: hypothetical protein VGG99_18185 [Acetobacteraceae bacterium]|jgi:hypothetical protein
MPTDAKFEPAALLLCVAYRNVISDANIELAHEQFVSLAGQPIDYATFCDAIAACWRDHLIREPIRLPEGALQCHWHLELTPKGVAAARAFIADMSE